MDELLHHCLRELSFDGDLGCNVSRLRDFIIEFYAHSEASQTPDDSFCAFVWSLVVQQPTVRVGTVPSSVTSEVWVAPQTSAKRKAKAKGQEHVETTPTQLDIVPGAQDRTLEDLKQEYGDKLRIAVDSDAIYAAITGSHIRFAKMSPMVYSALQIITRGRDNGITVVGLGQQSKYDQKTCFYLVKQLTDLDLVVKVRRGGVGTHFCIHKYFFDRSPSWKAIRDEEIRAEDLHNSGPPPTSELLEEEDGSTDIQSLDFTPIDARHLSSLPLIRGRVVKLLKTSRNQMHASNNMLITLGFSNPTKTDRRFFQSRIREMIQQGLIEKVVVPSNKKKSANSSVKCFRLVTRDQNEKVDEDGIIIQDGDDDDKDVGEPTGVKMNITIHKQIFDLLEDSGMVGMTLNELSAALCHFDKRTIELLLTRAEKFPPPSHLSDLGIAGLMETSGRERRHRYFTVAAYRQLVAKENLDNITAGYTNIDFTNVGGFLPIDPNLFYEDELDLFKYQDAFKDIEKANGKPRKRVSKNPILADGSVKQGRPRKYPIGEDPKSLRKQANKRKREAAASGDLAVDDLPEEGSPPAKRRRKEGKGEIEPKKRAAPKKAATPAKVPKPHGGVPKEKSKDDGSDAEEISTPVPKKRGRRSKSKPDAGEGDTSAAPPKKRQMKGRDQLSPVDQSLTASRKENRVAPPTEDIDMEEVAPASEIGSLVETILSRIGSPHLQLTHASPPALILSRPTTTGPTEALATDEIAVGTKQTIHKVPTSSPPREPSPSPEMPPATGPVSASTDSNPDAPDPLQTQAPHADSNAIPIDPVLMMDVLEHTKSILHGHFNAPIESPREQHSGAQSQDATPAPHPEPTRGNDKTEPGQPRKKYSRETRVNVSHLRRENELYRVIENLGGIVNIQTKDFFEEHMALLETMAKAGEATSAPVGTRTDKRTAATTFDNMERRGRIKMLKTAVMTHTGVRRPACIVYLPTIEQDKLNAFLADLARGLHPAAPNPGNFLKIDEHVEYGADPTSVARGALPLQLLQMEQPGDDRKERWSRNLARAEQLFSYEDSVIREVLLTERTTVAQLYGFIVGKAVRSRELHLSTLDAFEKRDPSPHIISHEHRIIDLSFFCHDIPLGLYCSLVSSLSHDEELTRFVATEEGRLTLVRDVPASLNFMLQIGRSRARSRFLDVLETLRALKLVTPLQPSASDTPWITCTSAEDRPSAFDVASLDSWTVSTPNAAPTYWHFSCIGPIHVFAVAEVSPPFWRDVPVVSTADGMNFWQLLEEASINPNLSVTEGAVSVTGPSSVGISVARSLRRHVSWNPNYILTWHQMQYMRQFAESSSGNTPLQHEDGGAAEIEKIAWVVSAPQASVRNFFETTHEKLLKDMERLRKRADQPDKRTKRAAATKASLAKKAADARSHREADWETMMIRFHPTPLEGAAAVRVSRVRTQFLQAGSIKSIERWEGDVAEAIREAEIVTKKVLKTPHKRTFITRTIPVPVDTPLTVAVNPPEKPVETLIALQGPPIVPRQDKAKRKRKGKGITDESSQPKPKALRRHRFQWNRDYEELARDASAIIKARCRNLSRLDWAAFEQVFPAVPRNTVRQRLAHIRETPGNEAYLTRLEDRWYDIWMQHRGTPLLPDDDPTSTSNFDLIKHIEFLRQHVDKNALRVGFAQPKEKAGTTISSSIDILLEDYNVLETTPAAPPWDFVWNAIVEEGREKRMLRQPFLRTVEEIPFVGHPPAEAVSLAESAVKMTLGTPHEVYDPESASALLHTVGEQYVLPATKNLLSRGILSKLVRDPQKQKPGRQLKISEVNQNAIGGSIPRDTFQDAAALEDISLQDGTWREWPLLATDGDSAALIQLVSDNKVEFKVDTSQAQLARVPLDWNSKKADDDQIETAVYIRTELLTTPLPPPPPPGQSPESSPSLALVELPVEYLPGHGQSVDGGIACCRKLTGGLADCMGCLEHEWTSFNDSLTPEERDLATHVLTIVRQGGENGVTKSHLLRSTNMGATSRQLFSIVKRMTESPVPMLFWTGYSSLVLVSSAYIRNWTVLVSESPATRIFPRRWFDISGEKIAELWEAALKAVMGVIIFRPGVTQASLEAELRWRLRSVYDRQEVGDLVRWLQDEGYLKHRCDPDIEEDNLKVGVLDDQEERGVFWFLGDEKHWYQV